MRSCKSSVIQMDVRVSAPSIRFVHRQPSIDGGVLNFRETWTVLELGLGEVFWLLCVQKAWSIAIIAIALKPIRLTYCFHIEIKINYFILFLL
jgi:hypothetical protein